MSTVNSQQSTVNSQQSTVNSQQSTVNSQHKYFLLHTKNILLISNKNHKLKKNYFLGVL